MPSGSAPPHCTFVYNVYTIILNIAYDMTPVTLTPTVAGVDGQNFSFD